MLVGFRSAVAAINTRNAAIVTPDDNLAAKYAWLKSSSRDSEMGALAEDNRRTIILAPGKHTLAETMTLGTNYVDIVSLSGDPKDTFVTGTLDTTYLMEQTADTITLIGFTIKNIGSQSYGLNVNPSGDNSDSLYRWMEFRVLNPGVSTAQPVSCQAGETGTWEYCYGDQFAWKLLSAGTFDPTMRYCTGGYQSFAGDINGGIISGRYENCIGGDQSFGGCGGRGMPIGADAVFIDCEAGEKSYGLGYECAGSFTRCKGGEMCFGGWAGGSYYGRFSGYALDCEAGDYSFGMGDGDTSGHTKCYVSGRLERCTFGDKDRYAAGIFGRAGSDIDVYDQSVAASVTTNLDGANNDLTVTMQKVGTWGNVYALQYLQYTGPKPLGTVEISTNNVIRVRIDDGVSTAADVKGYLEADSDTANLVTVAYADGDGSGTVTIMSAVDFAGGIDKSFFRSNHPWIPTVCIDDQVVRAFDNGHIFTNEGATETVEFTLPEARVGLKYTFVKIEQQDVLITPNGNDTIDGLADLDNTAAESDKFVTLKCFKDGAWLSVDKTGTWA